MAKYLAILDTAYRATLEEQDDPIIWLTHSLRGAGADVHVLLRQAAVNYGVKGQDASGLSFGGKRQTQPPNIERDLVTLIEKGAHVYYVAEDAEQRGIAPQEILPALEPVHFSDLPSLFGGFEQVWHW